MKKTNFLFAAISLAAALGVLAFTIPQTTEQKIPVANADLTPNDVMCATGPTTALATAKWFNPEDYADPKAVMIRKSIYSYSAAEITSLKAGIAAMKALPTSNPTSWNYQAAIHGTTLSGSMPSWNSCAHGTQFFLSWHRMYLYFFERILRAKSGNPNLTLPYWDYQTNAALHPDYRNSAAGNALYDASRSASINGGGSLPASISTSINTSLTNVPFNTFQSTLEGPHGSVHVSIGGNMGSVSTAGKDPCFWLHHTNIDRLWEVWLKKCKGRANPTTAPWTTQVFTFFDENGTAVNMTGSQVVNTASSLNYRYDLPLSIACNFLFKDWKWMVYRPYKLINPLLLNQALVKTTFREAKLSNDAPIVKNLALRLTSTDAATDKVLVEFSGLKVEKMPEGVIEVYLNLPAGTKADPKTKFFAGTLDLFTAAAHQNKDMPLRMDISEAVNALQIKAGNLNAIDLTFVVRGNKTASGKEVRTQASVRAEALELVVEKLQ